MRLLNNIAHFEFNELLAAGISRRTALRLPKVKDPNDERRILVQYDQLTDLYKQCLIAAYGDPYKMASKQTIESQLVCSPADVHFITTYQIHDNTYLPQDVQTKYLESLKYLHLLDRADRSLLTALGFDSRRAFVDAVITRIGANGVDLPTNYSRLMGKVRDYVKIGPACVVHKAWGNQFAAKITAEVSKAIVHKLLSHHNQFDDVFVCERYNEWAKTNGHKAVSPVTIGNIRRELGAFLAPTRKGAAEFGRFDKIIHRQRSSSPLFFVNGDDNHLDLFYRANGKDYNRVVLYVVMDTFNDYILGWAWAPQANKSLIKAAYANAIQHIYELTGSYYIWHQNMTDRYAMAELKPWFEKQAKFTPQQWKNARSKPIERAFGKEWHRVLKLFPNYSGPNITAKNRIDLGAVSMHKDQWPDLNGLLGQIEALITHLRTSKGKDGLSKQDAWVEKFKGLNDEQKRALSDKERLLWFGLEHPYSNTLTNGGLQVTIDGDKQIFDIPNQDYLEHVGKKVRVLYDPYNLNSVLATDEERSLQILCPAYDKVPMALADRKAGDGHRIHERMEERKKIKRNVADFHEKTEKTLTESAIDMVSILNPVTPKELKQDAETRFLEAQATGHESRPVSDVFDFYRPEDFGAEEEK